MNFRIFLILAILLGIVIYAYNSPADLKSHGAMDVSMNFRSLQRLNYDEKALREDKSHRPESVSLVLNMDKVGLSGLISTLPPVDQNLFSAFYFEVGEENQRELNHYLLVRSNLTHDLNLSIVPAEKLGSLAINGKVVGEYALIPHPLYFSLSKGNGPVAKNHQGSLKLSPLSERYEVFKKMSFKQLPPDDGAWYIWNATIHAWERWSKWYEGWPI